MMRDHSTLARAHLTILLAAMVPGAVHAQAPAAQPSDTSVSASASFPGDRFIGANTPIAFTLTRPIGATEGRLALVVGSMDVTALTERSPTAITYRPRTVRLPSGESEAVLYLVRGLTWIELARSPIKVLAVGGFTTASVDPSAAFNLKGQLAEGHSDDSPQPDRPTYQDVTMNGGLQSTHVRGGWTLRTQSNYLGVSRREEALRYTVRRDEAPRFDLSDYTVQLERGQTAFALGHVTTGSNRYLMNALASRGVSAAVGGGVANLAVAAVNGSSIVGWNNFTGLDHGDHRIYSATLGVELRPKRPGALHLDMTALGGSLLPQTGFTQGAVVDAERSTGGGVQFSASTPSQRLRGAAGYSRSRFDNPSRDPQLDDVGAVPVRQETRGARYAEVTAGLLQNATLAKLFSTTLTAGYRYERVDPLYRSVAAFVQSDRLQHAFELGGNVGAISVQLTHGRGSDNLDHLASVLTTRTRMSTAVASVPTAGLFRVRHHASGWPVLTYGLNRAHQVGAGVPVNGDFSATHVPDQMNVVHDASIGWQVQNWRLQYRYNRSDQDNRQIGRERADLGGTASVVTLGFSVAENVEIGLDLSDERQSNRELVQRTRVRRVGGTVNWRMTHRTTLNAFASASTSSDEPRMTDADNGEMRFELARSFALWRNPGGGTTRGQLFLRYANQSSTLLQRSFEAASFPALRTARGTWTLSSGASLRLF